jgi:hypothetical protein
MKTALNSTSEKLLKLVRKQAYEEGKREAANACFLPVEDVCDQEKMREFPYSLLLANLEFHAKPVNGGILFIVDEKDAAKLRKIAKESGL